MMRYVGLKYVDIGSGIGDRIGDRIGSDRGEDEFKDQPRLINYNKIKVKDNKHGIMEVRQRQVCQTDKSYNIEEKVVFVRGF